MDIENMKNIVVLKNVPSNIIEEAFVVLKDNIKIHKQERVGNKEHIDMKDEKIKDKDYVIKEAELIVSEYIKKIENKEFKEKKETKKLKEKCKKLKYTTIFFAGFSIFLIGLILIK